MTGIAPQWRLLLGATLISFSSVFVRLVSVPATTSGFYRVFFGSLALCAYILVTRHPVRLTRCAVIALIAAAVCFTADLWFWHRSIQLVGPGLSTLLANFQVFMVTIFGAVFLGQRATPRQIVAIPLAIAGLALIVGTDWRSLPEAYRLGVIFGLLTALSYALYLMTLRRAQQESHAAVPLSELAVVSILTAVFLAAIAQFENVSLAIPTATDAGWLVCYGVFAHTIGWLLIASGLPKVTPAVIGLSLLFQPLLSFVWEILFFGRGITPIEIFGVILVLFAIFVGSARKRRAAAP